MKRPGQLIRESADAIRALSEGYSRYEEARYILPTGTKINPAAPQTAEYYDEGQVAFVMRRLDEDRSRPTRCFTSFGGSVGEDSGWQIGSKHSCYHDQSGKFLGDYETVGTVVFKTMEKQGDVPSVKMSHCVFK